MQDDVIPGDINCFDTIPECDGQTVVLCEYSKFRIESNSYSSIRFGLK